MKEVGTAAVYGRKLMIAESAVCSMVKTSTKSVVSKTWCAWIYIHYTIPATDS